MKKQLLKRLNQIAKMAEVTGIQGQLSISFEGCTVKEADEAIEGITEYKRYNHNFEITKGLNVAILFN